MIQNTVQLSEKFKKEAISSIFFIILFFIVYLALIVAAILLMIFCVYGAIFLFSVGFSIVTGALAIGLISLGFMVLFFLFKFLFKSYTIDLSHLTEVKQTEEPELYALIDEVVKAVGSDFPKKIYLSAGVNASVFYNSTFWSMILPIGKNLNIGIGLVNSVTPDPILKFFFSFFNPFNFSQYSSLCQTNFCSSIVGIHFQKYIIFLNKAELINIFVFLSHKSNSQ